MTGAAATEMSWGRGIVRATIALVVSIILFVVLPDRLLAYLSLHLVPFWRDVLMLGYVAIAFVAGCFVFMRLQRVRT
jgi:hypothetical protein